MSKANPFEQPQIRWLVVVMALLSVGSGLVVGIVGEVGILPTPIEDPIWIPFFIWSCLVVAWPGTSSSMALKGLRCDL